MTAHHIWMLEAFAQALSGIGDLFIGGGVMLFAMTAAEAFAVWRAERSR